MTSAVSISPAIRRVRADNPSPLTGTGTNTYLIGTKEIAVIDPGPDLDGHLSSILEAIGGTPVTAILVTHAHRDHSALAPRLATATGAEVLAYGTVRDGISPRMAALRGSFGGSQEGLDLSFTPDRRIADGEVVSGADWALRVLHTPGHLGGHVCLALNQTLFSGDHVMGWSTSVVSPPEGDMGAYMSSLARLGAETWEIALPGHGETVTKPGARIAELAAHRRMREAQVLEGLATGPATATGLALRIYKDLPAGLQPAATRNVIAHLIDLYVRNRVAADRELGPETQWKII